MNSHQQGLVDHFIALYGGLSQSTLALMLVRDMTYWYRQLRTIDNPPVEENCLFVLNLLSIIIKEQGYSVESRTQIAEFCISAIQDSGLFMNDWREIHSLFNLECIEPELEIT